MTKEKTSEDQINIFLLSGFCTTNDAKYSGQRLVLHIVAAGEWKMPSCFAFKCQTAM